MSWIEARLTVTVLVLVACGPEPARLSIEENARSFVIVRESDAHPLSAAAYSLEESIQLQLDEDDRVTILWYASPLEELRLEPGVLEPATTGTQRALPAPLSTFQGNVDANGDIVELAETDTLPAAVRDFRLPELTLEECVEARGCYPSTLVDLIGERRCRVPCPEPDAPMLPLPPEPPVFTPCPSGWSQDDGGAFPVCVPPPIVDRVCGPHQVQFAGDEVCTPIGTVCPPAGEWAPNLSDNAIFVRPNATGGIGTRIAPFGTIAEATGVAVAGSVIALAEGTYDEHVVLPAAVSLLGACVERTSIVSTSTSVTEATVRVDGDDVVIANLAIVSTAHIILLVERNAALAARDLEISGGGEHAIVVYGSIEAERVSIHDVNVALYALLEANDRVKLRRFHAERAGRYGLALGGLGQGELESVTIRDNVRRASTPKVVGLAASLAALTISTLRLEGTGNLGIEIGGGVQLTLEDAVVSRVEDFGEAKGIGLYVDANSRVEVRRAEFREVSIGVLVTGGSKTLLENVVVESQRHPSASDTGDGIITDAGMVLRRVRVDAERVGFAVRAPATATITDSMITVVSESETSTAVIPSAVEQSGGKLFAERLAVTGVGGLSVGHRGHAVIAGLRMMGTGSGLLLDVTDARFDGVRIAAGGTALAAVNLRAAAQGVVSDLSVDGDMIGAQINSGGMLSMSRIAFEGTRNADLVAGSAGISATDVTVRSADADPMRRAFAAYDGGSIQVSRFDVDREGSVGCSIEESDIELHHGRFRNLSFVTDAEPETFDVRRLLDGVVLEGNITLTKP